MQPFPGETIIQWMPTIQQYLGAFLTYRHPDVDVDIDFDVDVDVAMDRLSSSACIQREQLPVERVSTFCQ